MLECGGKKTYPGKGSANKDRKLFQKMFGKTMRVYQCNKCRLFHLTTKEKDFKKVRKKRWRDDRVCQSRLLKEM